MEGEKTRVYIRYTDAEEEGVWKDPETGFIASYEKCPDDPNECYGVIDWETLGEPEGGAAENCASGIEDKYTIDLTCDSILSVLCEEATTELNLRGLCAATLIGSKYLMSPEPINRKRFFFGYTGWTLVFKEFWKLNNPTVSDTFAKARSATSGSR